MEVMKDNNSMQGKISVIIPAYNCENTIEYCIDSILNQTYNNLEVIIVDDGSIDSTFEVSQAIVERDHRVTVYRKENGGQASARNYGLDRCTGMYITFVDDDDYIDKNMYEILVGKIEEYDVKVAGCGTCAEDEKGFVISTTQFGKSGLKRGKDVIFNLLYGTKACWGTVWNKVFSACMKDMLYFPSGCELEDYWVILRLLYNIEYVYYSDLKMYHWIQRSTSQSHRFFHANMLTTLHVVDDIIKYYEEKESSKSYINACLYYKETLLASLVIRMWKTSEDDTIKELINKIIPLFKKYITHGIRITKLRLQHTKDFVHACIICLLCDLKDVLWKES